MWKFARLARRGTFGQSFSAQSSEAAALAQKLAALHPDKADVDLAEQLRPTLRRRGVKVSEELYVLEATAPPAYERARQLVELAADPEAK